MTEHGVDPRALARFEDEMLPLLDDAYTLARYLTRDEHDAQDVVQEAYLRALRYHEGYRGGDARVWLLTIVRNTCFTWRRRNRPSSTVAYDDDAHGARIGSIPPADAAASDDSERAALRRALDALPTEHREVIVLREVEELSYKDIARIAGVPVGTVMSRLARARLRLRQLIRGAREAS